MYRDFLGGDYTGYGVAGDLIPRSVERLLHLILDDALYASEDEKVSVKIGKWLKAQALKG